MRGCLRDCGFKGHITDLLTKTTTSSHQQLIASEKRLRGELEEAQQRLKYLEEKDRRDSRRLSDDDAVRKIRALEEAVHQLQKKLGEKKQVIIQ